MKKILIVEDEMPICLELVELLKNEGYDAVYLESFNHVGEDILRAGADLVLLDINIPGINGEMVLKGLRRESQVPVIMVTSRTSEFDEVLSMSYGADDYITKPYNPTILLLRIAAILKRAGDGFGVTAYRECQVNLGKGTIRKGDREVVLTKNEMLIFGLLLQNQSRIVSRDEIMTALWDNDEFINDNALTVNISRLRAKLVDIGEPDAIETRKKQGYCLL